MAHSLVWMPTEEIIRKVPCSCIDGRTQGLRYSAAGGSFGLIVQTLAHIEASCDTALGQHEVDAYLNLFADKIGPIYLHSDQHTLDRLFARVGLPPDTQINQLTPEQQCTFRELATLPHFQGCGHIQLIMLNEADYHIPLVLIQRALRAFFRLYFKGADNLIFDVLAGRHREEEVVLFDESRAIADAEQSALYLNDGIRAERFFCHRPLKRTLIKTFLNAIDEAGLQGLPDSEWDNVVDSHNAAADITLHRLAPDLPIKHLDVVQGAPNQ